MLIPHRADELSRIKDVDLREALHSMWTKLVKSMNGRLDFGSPQAQAKGFRGNIDGVWPGIYAGGYMITTPGANVEFTVTHNLSRIPSGYDIRSIDKAAHVYDSRKASWTTTQMFLKCDQATTHLVLFVH